MLQPVPPELGDSSGDLCVATAQSQASQVSYPPKQPTVQP